MVTVVVQTVDGQVQDFLDTILVLFLGVLGVTNKNSLVDTLKLVPRQWHEMNKHENTELVLRHQQLCL